MSNYKGFPLCQANEVLEPRSGSIHFGLHLLRLIASPRLRASHRVFEPRCGRTNYNRSFVQHVVLRTLMKDARGGLIR
jgi:hypothetical protein